MEDNLEQLRYPIGRYTQLTAYNPELLKEWITVLKALPSWMDACIENLDTYQLETHYRDGGWTVQQVVHHVADSHINAYVRLKLALTEEDPTIKPYLEDKWAGLDDVKDVPVNISVTLLHTIHTRMVAILNKMKPEDWERAYYHPELKRQVPLWEMTGMYAWHSKHHTEHIRQLRERMGWHY
jgi:hypothetical protein